MWTFHIPVKIHFGIGSLAAELVPAVAGRRAAVVISKSVAKLETVKNVLEQLNPIAAFDAVQPNPTVANADAVADVLKESGAEVVVAIGGGSVLDAAKAAAFLAANNEKSIRPFHSEGKPVSGNSLPLIAVPTTAGTGSEVTPISVLDDEEKHIKAPISSPLFYPATAIVDPAVTIFVPLKTTAAAALDALSHCIEGYWSNNHQPICDTLAKEAAKIILTNFDKVIGNLQNLQSRE
ncbi:MAG: iron-containing alcohol dehydrogenase, partial [Planctomycetaceae bacterium]|nr:iron-containing alcohol dehydrogenase [Planctomycetaceae bacterium]